MIEVDESVLRAGIRQLAEALVPDLESGAAVAIASDEEPMMRLVDVHTTQQSRRPRVFVTAAVTMAATLVAGLIVVHFSTDERPTVAPGTVGRYFVPASLPAGWTLLDVTESAGGPGRPPETIYGRDTPPAKLSLLAFPASSPTYSGATPFDPPLSGSWGFQGAAQLDITFIVYVADRAVTGQATGLNVTELQRLLRTVELDDQGRPIMTGLTGFTLVAQAATTESAVAQYQAVYGHLGTGAKAGRLLLTMTRLEHPHDPQLIFGVDVETSEINGRRIYTMGWHERGMALRPVVWYPQPDLRIELDGTDFSDASGGWNMTDIAANLEEVTTNEIDSDIAAIGKNAKDIAVSATASFGEATVTMLGPQLDPSGICLSMQSETKCTLNVGPMATNFFSPKGFLVESFLIDGQWLIVGFDLVDKFATITSDDGAPTVATTKDEHGHTWSLAHIPDNATTANLGIDTPPFVNFQRPVR